MDPASSKTINNKEKERFELHLDDLMALIDYKVGKTGNVYLTHTEVPDQLEGKGIGHKLVREALAMLEANDDKIIPLCPFVRSFLIKHQDDYRHILAEGVKL